VAKRPSDGDADDATAAVAVLTAILDSSSTVSDCLASFLVELVPKIDGKILERARGDRRFRKRFAAQVVNAWFRFVVRWRTGRGYELRILAGLGPPVELRDGRKDKDTGRRAPIIKLSAEYDALRFTLTKQWRNERALRCPNHITTRSHRLLELYPELRRLKVSKLSQLKNPSAVARALVEVRAHLSGIQSQISRTKRNPVSVLDDVARMWGRGGAWPSFDQVGQYYDGARERSMRRYLTKPL
jgi:hypothetical protein